MMKTLFDMSNRRIDFRPGFWGALFGVLVLFSVTSQAAIQCDENPQLLPVAVTLQGMAANAWYGWPGGGPVNYTDSYEMAAQVEDDILSYFHGSGVVARCGTPFSPSRRAYAWWPGCHSGASLLNQHFSVHDDPPRDGYARIVDENDVPWDMHCPQACEAPFSANYETDECEVYCPPQKPHFDAGTGTCVPPPGQKKVQEQCQGNPVIVNSGEKIQVEAPDYQGKGPLPLRYQRTYRSFRSLETEWFFRRQHVPNFPVDLSLVDRSGWVRHVQPDGYRAPPYLLRDPWTVDEQALIHPPAVGFRQWWGSYQSQLVVIPNGVAIIRESGPQIYRLQNGDYVSEHLELDRVYAHTFADESEGWMYYRSPRYREYYDASGRLVKIAQSPQVFQRLIYNASGQLIQVTHSLGGSLNWVYDAEGRLQQLLTPDNQTLTYQYDAIGNLLQVTRSGVNQTGGLESSQRQYHYEEPRHPFALTGISNEKGVLYARWAYDYSGRAIRSEHANAHQRMQFDYTDMRAIRVTNAVGKESVYRYTDGLRRFKYLEGVASMHCAKTQQAYHYHGNGLFKQITDKEGNRTRYAYNDKHQVSQLFEASDNRYHQRVTTLDWHAVWPVVVTKTEPTRVTHYQYDEQGRLIEQTIRPRQ